MRQGRAVSVDQQGAAVAPGSAYRACATDRPSPIASLLNVLAAFGSAELRPSGTRVAEPMAQHGRYE
jgi:hypothetical protein